LQLLDHVGRGKKRRLWKYTVRGETKKIPLSGGGGDDFSTLQYKGGGESWTNRGELRSGRHGPG